MKTSAHAKPTIGFGWIGLSPIPRRVGKWPAPYAGTRRDSRDARGLKQLKPTADAETEPARPGLIHGARFKRRGRGDDD